MKHLFPTITCLMTAHMKPTIGEAIRSVLSQTRQDFALIIIDSGQWVRKSDPVSKKISEEYLTYCIDPRVEWIFTGERYQMYKDTCMVSHVFNEAYTTGIIRGRYVCTFYDDDIYFPTFFEKMAGYLDEHPDSDIVRCSEQWTVLKPEKERDWRLESTDIRVLRADKTLTNQDQLDQVVDGMQVMFRKSVLDKMDKPLMTTRPDECRHSDGIFFESMKKVISKMDYIDEILCRHRFTPHSVFTPSGSI